MQSSLLFSACTIVKILLLITLNNIFQVNTSHDLWKFFLVTVISLVLNQTWIAVYMMVICAYPRIAHRVCPMVSAIAGFAGGFLVPRPAMPAGYVMVTPCCFISLELPAHASFGSSSLLTAIPTPKSVSLNLNERQLICYILMYN